MHFSNAILAASLAFMTSAVPLQGHSHRHAHLEERDGDKFKIHVTNNCGSTKSFGLFQITSAFQMIQKSQPHNIPNGETHVIHAPYKQLGMRLSATADQGPDAQWDAQTLFEFGYSAWSGVEGTAYDLSLMEGSTDPLGLSVTPHNTACPAKSCPPTGCTASQGWTNPDQVDSGSPADTVCYHGKTNFHVTFCPS